jgi:hypothetical protein
MAIGSNHRNVQKRLIYVGIAVEFRREKRDDTASQRTFLTGLTAMGNITTLKVCFESARRKYGIPALCAFSVVALGYGALLYYISQGTGGL